MSEAFCPLCGSADTRPGYWDLQHCRGCDHRFASFPAGSSDSTPAELYDERYFRGGVYRDYPGEAGERTERFAGKLRLLEALLPPAGRALDVGCATGLFLGLLKERGWRVWGVEISAFAARYARRMRGARIVAVDLREAGFPAESFDLVSFWDTLEHLGDPAGTLRAAGRLLRDSGLLLVETLNVGSLSRALLGSRWPLLAPPYHLQYFSRRSLRALLGREGFRILRAIPIQTYLRIGGRTRVWPYYSSGLLRATVGVLAADVVLYAALKDPSSSLTSWSAPFSSKR